MAKDWGADEEVEKDRADEEVGKDGPEYRTVLETTYRNAGEETLRSMSPWDSGSRAASSSPLHRALEKLPHQQPSLFHARRSPWAGGWAGRLEEQQTKVCRVSILRQELQAPLFWGKV